MDVMVIAGASFPCEVRELGEVGQRHGIRPQFIDHPKNAALVGKELPQLRLEPGLSEEVGQQNGHFLPLLESWVSEALRLSTALRLRFDRRAALISRSKFLLSTTLAQAGIASVQRRRVETSEQALDAAKECGYPAVLRGDIGYSSRGLWIVNSPEELQACWLFQREECDTADFIEMCRVMDANRVRFLIEPWIGGDEWSIDCINGPTGTQLVRVCQKAVTIVAGKPISLGYRLVDSPAFLAELRQVVPLWASALFHADQVSFACFDIRRHPNGNLVPLDFGVRLGGDQIPLLVRRAGRNGNPYAAALDSALAADPGRMGAVDAGFAIVHAFARQSGTFKGITLSQPAEVIDIKPSGFLVESQGQGRTFCRVGTVLTQFGTESAFFDACESAADWIHVVCD